MSSPDELAMKFELMAAMLCFFKTVQRHTAVAFPLDRTVLEALELFFWKSDSPHSRASTFVDK
jgi:hypothetical protein